MAESTVAKVRKDGIITINDGTATPYTYTVAYEDGDFQASWPKRDSIAIRDRGTIVGERYGDQALGTLSFTVHMREFTDAAAATIIDVIDRLGTWAAYVTTGGTGYESFMHGVTMSCEGTDYGDSVDHTLVFSKVKLSWAFAEGDPNKISVTGEVWAAPTKTGPAA